MVTIEQVNARMDQIIQEVAKLNKTISDYNTEYQQLLGYRQALLDAQPPEAFEQKEARDILDKPGLLEG